MALRIAVDLVFFTGRKGGTESVARGLYPALAKHEDLELVGIGNRRLAADPPPWFPGEIVGLPVDGENRPAWAAAVALAVAPRARLLGADVLHCPSNFGPALRLLPTVVTVHDVLPMRHPEWVPNGRSWGVQALSTATVRAASRIITDSEASAADIRALWPRHPPIDVIPLGFDPPAAPAAESRVSDRPYALTGGNRMPHKNFERLLHAWTLIPKAERPKLVVTGSHGEDPLAPLVGALELDEDVELLGWVAEDRLAELYGGASVYVFPSLFEGFGLPVLEAMARGCPVVASDIAVLREVGGDAGVYVDPLDPAAIASAVRCVIGDQDVRADLVSAGRARAASFTWARTAAETAAVFRALAAPGRSEVRKPGYFEWHEQPGYWRDVVRHFEPGDEILDLGCGTGWLSDHFRCYRGLDGSPDAVRLARERGRPVELHDLDEALPVEDRSVDGVVLKDVLEHVADPVAVVREARRVLRPGGRVFASSPDAQRWVWDDYTHRRPFTRRAFRLLFADQGFVVEQHGFESVVPGSSIVSGWTPSKRRPLPLRALARLPLAPRNVWILASRPESDTS